MFLNLNKTDLKLISKLGEMFFENFSKNRKTVKFIANLSNI